MKNLIFLYLSLIVLLGSCEDSFVPDLQDPRLTRYTHKGLGNASAMINGAAWVHYQDVCIYCFTENYFDVVYYTVGDSLFLQFWGVRNEDESIQIQFKLSGLQFESFSQLRNRKIILGEGNNFATIDPYGEKPQNQTGQIWFREVTTSDEINGKCSIVSGTFGFEYQNPGQEKVTAHFGRFDLKICGVTVY